MSDADFRLPGSSYDFLAKVIQAYGELDAPAGPADVGNLVGTHATNVSRNNGFLLSAGVVEGGNKKVATETGRKLGQALHWGREDEVRQYWQALLAENDFIDKVLTAVKVRRGMARSDLESHIAYTAGQKKTSSVMTGAAAVVDVLLTAGLVRDLEGQLEIVRGEQSSGSGTKQVVLPTEGTLTVPGPKGATGPRTGVSPQLNIALQIQCKPDDLDGLAERIRIFLSELSQPDSGDASLTDD